MDTAIFCGGLGLALLLVGAIHRAEQKARRTWEADVDARLAEHAGRLAGHASRLSTIASVVDAHVAAHDFDARKTVELPRPTDAELAAARTANTAAALEVAHLPEPPVDREGDRGGINPGDPVPESAGDNEAIRARMEAGADARGEQTASSTTPGSERRPVPMDRQTERAVEARATARLRELSAAMGKGGDEPPGDDEKTQVFESIRASQRRTLFGGLGAVQPPAPVAGVKAESPTPRPARAADAVPLRHVSSPTLVSAGNEPPEALGASALERSAHGPTTPPGAPANDGGAR